MGFRNAPRTILRFVAAVTGLHFVLSLGLLLLVVAGRTLGGQYPIPDESAEPLVDLALLLSTLLGAWFLVEERSLKRLFAFAFSVWVLFVLPLATIAAVAPVLGSLRVGPAGAGALIVVAGLFAYLWSYRLVYPDAFAERRKSIGLGT